MEQFFLVFSAAVKVTVFTGKTCIAAFVKALRMQCMSNLFRSMSPVAAVIIIVSASVKVNPLVLVKRTWVPLMSGVVVVLALSFFKYM